MSRLALRSTLAGLTLALGAGMLAAPAIAAPDQDGQPKRTLEDRKHDRRHDDQRRHHGPGMMMRDGLMIPGLGPISKKQIDELKLSADQQAKVEAARTAQRELFESRRGAERHALLDKQLAEGKLDPRALLAEQSAGHEAFRKQADQVRDQWLAVWDSLNEAQRGQVAGMVKERQERIKAHFDKRGEHGPRGEGGMRGDAPPPPPPADNT